MRCSGCALFSAALALVAATASAATDIQHNGVTWTLAGDTHVTGTFVTGDPWVVGPVTVVAITTDRHAPGFEPRKGQDGSMVNPLVGHDRAKQGYDDGLPSYDPSLNAGRPNGRPVARANPLPLKAGSTLVSSVSWLYRSPQDAEPGCPRFNGTTKAPRPVTRAMGVLTVLAAAPAKGSFRPPYAGDDKTVRFHVDRLDRSKLLALDPVPATPDVSRLEEALSRTWVDHAFDWMGAMVHPSEHMPNYGRDMANILLEASLVLHLDVDQLPGKPSKDRLLISLVQFGIDSTGIADAGGGWRANGGHGLGRKWPILFAGAVLGDPHMTNVGRWPRGFNQGVEFQEDQQHFHVTEADVARTHGNAWAPDRRNVKRGQALPYDAEHVGMAEWGIRHAYRPEADNRHPAAMYRQINSGIIPGFALLARMMGLQDAWNHDAMFDYADRFMAEHDGGWGDGKKPVANALKPFPYQMWHAHAKRFPGPGRSKDGKRR